MKRRDDWVDYAKGIGILLVVYGHVARGVFSAGIPMDAGLFRLVDSIIYSFHMPLFFLLAGIYFIPSFEKYGRRGLILEKVNTIAYPYVIWSLLQGFIEVLLSRFTNSQTSVHEVLTLLWAPRAQFWFLHSLFGLFVLIAIVYQRRKPVFGWLLLLVALALWSGQVFLQLPLPLNPTLLVFFIIGILASHWRALFQSRPFACSIGSGCLLLTAQILFHRTSMDLSHLNLLLALFGIVFVLSLANLLARQNTHWVKGLAILGAYSMPIYLMHILAGSGARILLSKVFGVSDTKIHLIAGLLIGTLLPIYIYKLAGTPMFQYIKFLYHPPYWLALRTKVQ
jgi:fucose 4-O-acetylase-like acetyltransferase